MSAAIVVGRGRELRKMLNQWRRVMQKGVSAAVLAGALAAVAAWAAPAQALDIKVNFQDPATIPPVGYVRDSGESYGVRNGPNQGGGLTYGWVLPGTATPLDLSVGGTTPGNGRNRATPSDVRLATLMHMQGDDSPQPFNGTATEGAWEIAVPNGGYSVTVSVGDGGTAIDSTHSVRVEGIVAIAPFTPTAADKFRSASLNVVVTDGRLTVDAIGGFNTKINYIDISDGAPDTTPPTVDVQLSGTTQSPGVYVNQATVTISGADSGGAGLASLTFSLDGAAVPDLHRAGGGQHGRQPQRHRPRGGRRREFDRLVAGRLLRRHDAAQSLRDRASRTSTTARLTTTGSPSTASTAA